MRFFSKRLAFLTLAWKVLKDFRLDVLRQHVLRNATSLYFIDAIKIYVRTGELEILKEEVRTREAECSCQDVINQKMLSWQLQENFLSRLNRFSTNWCPKTCKMATVHVKLEISEATKFRKFLNIAKLQKAKRTHCLVVRNFMFHAH